MNMPRMPGVNTRTGKSRSTIYKECTEGLFTKPVKLGARASGWPEHEVDSINSARISGKSEDEIRQLVRDLEAKRRQAS